jgi:hypothetical protein
MQCDHFIFGKVGNIMRIFESKEAEKIISAANFRYLMDLGDPKFKQPLNTPIVTLFETEKIVAYTVLQESPDTNGRTIPINHTVLINYNDLFLEAKNQIVKQHLTKDFELKNFLPKSHIEL